MSSSPIQKQQQRYCINNNTQQSRNTNAYFNHEDYHRRSLINKSNYWNRNFYRSNDNFYTDSYYQHRQTYPSSSRLVRKGRQMINEQRHNSKSAFSSSSSSNNNHFYYDNIPPRHRPQHKLDKREQHSIHIKEPKTNNQVDEIKLAKSSISDEQPTRLLKSVSSSSTNSDMSNNTGLNHRKESHTKNLAATTAAIAARQQNSSSQTNFGVVQALMNSLILQHQQQPSQSQTQSTIQLQCQLTNALLGMMIQQRLKEAALQAQAQQIQATIPTLLAAQALVCQQQQGQLASTQQQVQSTLPPNIAYSGTKFNNRPLVKFPVIRPTMPVHSPTMMMPIIRPPIAPNFSRHRLGNGSQAIFSTTNLPTYQQVQEIERGISLDEAIHLKGAINIASLNNISNSTESESISIDNGNTTE